MKSDKQRVGLKLHRHTDKRGKRKWVLKYGKKKQDGTIGWATTDWKVREDSWTPKPLFFAIMNSVRFYTRKVPKTDKSFMTMERKIRVALSESASSCGCRFRENKFNGFTWFLDDKPFIDFAVVDYSKHSDRNYNGTRLLVLSQKLRDGRPDFRRMERKSEAMFRVAIAVIAGSALKFVPGNTLGGKS